MEWNKELNWQPIPYDYENLSQDSLLLVRKSCPRYHEELQRVFKEEVAGEISQHSELFANLSQITGQPIKSPDDVQSIFSTLQAEVRITFQLLEPLQLIQHRFRNNTASNFLRGPRTTIPTS
jgi:prostatic aicd phosphatase